MSTSLDLRAPGPVRPRRGHEGTPRLGPDRPWRATVLCAGVLCAGLAGASGPLVAQPNTADDVVTPVDVLVGGMAAYVDGFVADSRSWQGQRVPWPAATPRSLAERVVEARSWPLAVQGEARMLSQARADRWVTALENAYDLVAAQGWPLPPTDGGRGGTDGFDLYVLEELPAGDDDPLDDQSERRPRRSAARLDVPWYEVSQADGLHDAALVHAVVAHDVPDDRIDSCAVQLVVSAGLFAADPAEAESLREGTASWFAWANTGQFGCDDEALVRQQTASHRAFVTHDPRDGEGAALVFGALSARHDGYDTGFLRDVWTMARQRSWDGGELYGEPDVLRMLGQASTLAHDPLDRVIESLAVARYFAGTRPGTARPDVPLLAALPAEATVPVFVESRWERLPRTLRPSDATPPLEPWGSAYARVDVTGAPRGSVLRVWLEGETGTEWSLVAVRLDAVGAERGRTRAPPTRNARGFIPVELGEDTATVVIVVTNLPDDDDPRDRAAGASRDLGIAGRLHRTGLDADAPGPGPHGFRLIVDRGA